MKAEKLVSIMTIFLLILLALTWPVNADIQTPVLSKYNVYGGHLQFIWFINDSNFLISENGFLNVNESKFTNLFYLKNETYNQSEVYNKSEIDSQQLSQNNTIQSVNTTNNIESLVNDSYVNIDGDTWTGDMNASNNSIFEIASLTLDTTATTTGHVPSRMSWNVDEGTWDMESDINNTVGQMFYESWLRVVNKQGVTLDNCVPVYVSGVQGQRSTVKLANANSNITSSVVGLVTVETGIDDNQVGILVTDGTARGCDTSNLLVGFVYLNTSDGGLTSTPINGIDGFNILIGRVLNSHPTQGEIEVDIGITITGNVIVQNLYVRTNMTVIDRILLNDEGHYLKSGMETDTSGTSIANESFSFHHSENHSEGSILLDLTTEEDVNFWIIKKVEGGASGISNSFMAFPDNDLNGQKKNMSLVPTIISRWNNYGITPKLSYHSSINETSIAVLFGVETQRIVFHNDLGNGGLDGEGTFDMRLDGNDANFVNGSIHPQKDVTFISGFLPGDPFTILNVLFSSNLLPFINEGTSPFVWFQASSALCDEGGCAQAQGSSGSVDITINTTFSTLNVNETKISFVYSLFNVIGADNLRVETNNFSGSGWELQFTDSGTETVLTESFSLGEGYSNLSSIGLRFVCDVTALGRNCFVDTVKINGTFTANTSANESGVDSEICFSDGTRDLNNNCNRGIRYDAELDTIFFSGTINATGTITGGISGSGSTNSIPKFASSTSLTNSIASDDGSVFSIAGGLDVTGVSSASEFNGSLNWSLLQNLNTFSCAGFSLMDSWNQAGAGCTFPTAQYIKAGTFDAGNFTFQENVNVSGILYVNSSEQVCTSENALCVTGTVTSIATSSPISGGTITTTGTIGLTPCPNNQFYIYNTTSAAWECGSAGAGDITAVNTNGPYLSGGSSSGDVSLLFNESKGNLTYANIDGDSFTGNVSLINSSLKISTNHKTCYDGDACLVWTCYNGSALIFNNNNSEVTC